MQTKRSTSTKLLFVVVAVAVACWSAVSVSAWVAPSSSGVNANTNAAKATFNAKFHPIATRSTGKQHQHHHHHQYRYQSQFQSQFQSQYHSSNRPSNTRLYDTNNDNNNNSDGNNNSDDNNNTNSGNGNKLLEFLSPYDSKIPEELREEIYRAEANTPAARDRGTRVALYSLLAFVGIGLAAFNGFLTDLRDQETARIAAEATTAVASASPNSLYVLEEAGFGWVVANPVTKFLFTNKIGGVFSLLLGGGSGLMAEAEFDSKRLNAEKIYEELERRRAQKTKKQRKKSKQKSKNTTTSVGGKKKRRSGKEQKRLAAISEVVLEPKAESEAGAPASEATTATATEESAPGNDIDSESDNNKGGVFGKMKELYEKADSMAASQALIMNKNLEEAGLVEKITDETGLKVIGREKAKELEEESKQEQK